MLDLRYVMASYLLNLGLIQRNPSTDLQTLLNLYIGFRLLVILTVSAKKWSSAFLMKFTVSVMHSYLSFFICIPFQLVSSFITRSFIV
jgi:hypothetical protein